MQRPLPVTFSLELANSETLQSMSCLPVAITGRKQAIKLTVQPKIFRAPSVHTVRVGDAQHVLQHARLRSVRRRFVTQAAMPPGQEHQLARCALVTQATQHR